MAEPRATSPGTTVSWGSSPGSASDPSSGPPSSEPSAQRGFPFPRSDLFAFGAAVAVIVISSVVGFRLLSEGVPLVLPAPPLIAFWHPHLGWGSPLAVLALLLGLRLQQKAAGMSWPRLLLTGWLLALGWLCSLTLIDGFRKGWADVLLDPNEYLHDLPRIHSARTFLITFVQYIRYGAHPDLAWTTHVAGHPPLATLVFYGLRQIGLGGGFWAGTLCIVISSAVAVSLPVTIRALAGDGPARRLVPLVALFPGAVWMGVSADGLFAGVAISGLALTVLAASPTRSLLGRPRAHGTGFGRVLWGFCGGLLLGATLYLSYGLTLFGLVVLTALVITLRRHGRSAVPGWLAAVAGVLVVAGTFFALGFDWFVGMAQLKVRYRTSVASQRPYSYFVYADLGAWLISCSPLLAVGIRRSVHALIEGWRQHRWTEELLVGLVCLSGLLAALLADLSGLSKAETERIWLSFGLIAFSGLALLRGRAARWGLIGTAGTALLVNHLLDTGW